MVHFFVVVFEVFCGKRGVGNLIFGQRNMTKPFCTDFSVSVFKCLILRQKNLSKQWLLRFLDLNIKMLYRVYCEAFQELQHKIDPGRTFVLRYI